MVTKNKPKVGYMFSVSGSMFVQKIPNLVVTSFLVCLLFIYLFYFILLASPKKTKQLNKQSKKQRN